MAGPEKNVENSIRKLIVSRGGWVVKIFANAMQGTGYPDLIVCYKGVFIAFETKAPNGQVSKVQKATLAQIQRAGGIIASPRSVAHVKEILETIDNRSEAREIRRPPSEDA